MRQSKTTHGERIVPQGQPLKDIKRKTRKQYSAEESVRSAIGSRNSEPALCSTVCAAKKVSRSCAISKAYLRAFITNGRRTCWRLVKRLARDITRQANSTEVKGLRSEARELKECVAELTLENRSA